MSKTPAVFRAGLRPYEGFEEMMSQDGLIWPPIPAADRKPSDIVGSGDPTTIRVVGRFARTVQLTISNWSGQRPDLQDNLRSVGRPVWPSPSLRATSRTIRGGAKLTKSLRATRRVFLEKRSNPINVGQIARLPNLIEEGGQASSSRSAHRRHRSRGTPRNDVPSSLRATSMTIRGGAKQSDKRRTDCFDCHSVV